MKYKFNFGSEIVALPRSAAEYLHVASREKLAVLISLAAEPSMTAKKRAESLGLTESEVADAIAYWCALEVLAADGAERNKSAKVKETAKIDAKTEETAKGGTKTADGRASPGTKPASGKPASRTTDDKLTTDERPIALMNDTPHMTTGELTGAASDTDNARLLEHCQQLMGRVFNAAEAERIVAVRSYLGVSTDFIAMLCLHLKKEGKLTVRALENLAIELHDKGIVDAEGLFDYFDRREKAKAFETKVRSLFGLGSRALSSAEKKIVDKWASLGMGEDMIEFAYELTVDATGAASLKYSNAIVEKWAADGVKTLDEAKKREEKFRSRTESKGTKTARAAKAKKPENETISSFETDDFFERALRRSYGDDFYENVLNGEEDGASGAGSDKKK